MAKENFFILLFMMNSVLERSAEECKLGDKECTSLDLSQQQLTIIKSGMFNGKSSLTKLNLSLNEIKTKSQMLLQLSINWIAYFWVDNN